MYNIPNNLEDSSTASPALVLITGIIFAGASMLFTMAILTGALQHMPSRYITIPFRGIFCIICILSLIIGLRKNITALQAKILVPLILFFAIYLVQIIFEGYVKNVYLGNSPTYFLAMSMGAAFIPALALMQKLPQKAYTFSFKLIITIGLALVLSITLTFKEWLGRGRISVSATEVGFGPLHASYAGALIVILGCFILMNATKVRAFILGAAGMVLGFFPFVLGASRGAFISIVGGIILVYLSRVKRANKVGPTCLFMGTIAAATAVVIYSDLAGTIYRRLPQVQEQISLVSLLGGRFVLWSDAWRQTMANPIVGAGLVEGRSGFYPHNLIIEGMMATGLIGGACLVWILGFTFWKALKLLFAHEMKIYAWVPLMFIHYLIHSMLSGALYAQTGLWVTLGAVIGLSAKYEQLKSKQTSGI